MVYEHDQNDCCDVVIIGAGISGLAASYYLKKNCPNLKFRILEARSSVGGTWDLFRYPGIRSDSDMYTLGFPFRPWREGKAIAIGPSILSYLKETANDLKLEELKLIRFNEKVETASWIEDEKKWIITSRSSKGQETNITRCSFVIMCTGYYDYDQGYQPDFKNLNKFKGTFIHPQFWPENLDYQNKTIAVIGSGATAVTLVPELAKNAKKVIMIQRSPSYVLTIPSTDSLAQILKKILPASFAHRLTRGKNILIAFILYQLCQFFPKKMRKLLLSLVAKQLPNRPELLEHFLPRYNPWEQRLCFVPDSDFFLALDSGKADIVTSAIAEVNESGLILENGKSVNADIIVSATGLKLKFLSDIKFLVNGKPLDVQQATPYKSSMFNGIPNLAMSFGYINASWTLKTGLTCEWISKILQYMEHNNYKTVVPHFNQSEETLPLINMSSGYFQRSQHLLPRQGKKAPWRANQNYFLDFMDFKFRPIHDKDLEFRR